LSASGIIGIDYLYLASQQATTQANEKRRRKIKSGNQQATTTN